MLSTLKLRYACCSVLPSGNTARSSRFKYSCTIIQFISLILISKVEPSNALWRLDQALVRALLAMYFNRKSFSLRSRSICAWIFVRCISYGKCTGHQHAFLGKQSRASHAFQFANVRRLFCNRRHRLLKHTFLERPEKSPRRCKLCFLRRVESAI